MIRQYLGTHTIGQRIFARNGTREHFRSFAKEGDKRSMQSSFFWPKEVLQSNRTSSLLLKGAIIGTAVRVSHGWVWEMVDTVVEVVVVSKT